MHLVHGICHYQHGHNEVAHTHTWKSIATEDKDWEEEEYEMTMMVMRTMATYLRRSNPRPCDSHISHQPTCHVGISAYALPHCHVKVDFL